MRAAVRADRERDQPHTCGPSREPSEHRTARGRCGLTPPRQRGGSGRFLTDVLVELGFVDDERVAAAIEEARSAGMPPERLLLEQRAITAEQLSHAIAERYGLDHLDLGIFKVDMAAANLLSASAAKRYGAVPVAYVDERTLLLAMADPANVLAVDDIALLTRLDVRPAVASAEDIAALIARMNRFEDAVQEAVDEGEDGAAPVEIVDLRESAEDAPVIKLVHSIIAQAAERGASDIHFEPQPDDQGAPGASCACGCAIDGVLSDETTVPQRMVGGVISRIKIMSDLDISERRLPQDGRVGLTIEGRHVDLRVVTIPSVHGESVVLRILDKESDPPRARQARHAASTSSSASAARSTAPTARCWPPARPARASRRRSTARCSSSTRPRRTSSRSRTRSSTRSTGITQMQVNLKAGLTFANGLRSMMRADPDILMVGEIRDRETAQIAIEGALTGHMVLSTLHTNDAPVGDHAPDRDGDRAVPGRLGDRVRRRPAAGADAVPALQAAHDRPRRGAARPRLRRAVRHRGLRARRLRALRRHGLPRPHRPVRGDDDVRRRSAR